MSVSIQQAILHVLDSTISTPVLSDRTMELDGAVVEYLESHIEKAFSSEDCKACLFFEDSPFVGVVRGEDFVVKSKQIAEMLFELMVTSFTIPAGDLLVMEASIDECPYLVVLKMNYKEAYIHRYSQDEGQNLNSILVQKTVLPSPSGRAEEAVFINLHTMEVKLIEKKYEIDGEKVNALSTQILHCTESRSEKGKLKTIQKVAEKALKQHYDNDKKIKSDVTNIICEQAEQNGRVVNVREIKEAIAQEYPRAAQCFEEEMTAAEMELEDTVRISPSTLKRMEKQSIKSENGVEIKIPVSMLENGNSVEFINNPDGSISLLIKNIVL